MTIRPLPFGRSDRPTLIGMVHLAPLPGAPRWGGDWDAVLEAATRDAEAIVAAGFDAVMVENFNDAPFFKDDLPAETIAGLTRCALAVQAAAPVLPLGVNALRNDALGALGVAAAVGAAFIRVNVLTGAMVTDQGVIEGRGAEVVRTRARLCPQTAILADVQVKHAAPLAAYDAEQSARDLAQRGGADALVVSGHGTGRPVDAAHLTRVRDAMDAPVIVGSGTTPEDLRAPRADAYIIGTGLKDGARVSVDRARRYVEALTR